MCKKLFICSLLLGSAATLSAAGFRHMEPVPAKTVINSPVNTPASADPKDLIGRWDITIDMNGKPSPSWFEVKLSGYKTLVGYFVGTGGSARPVAQVNFDNGKFSFSIPPQWEKSNNNLELEGTLTDAGMEGTVVMPDGRKYQWKGVKAPYLKSTPAPSWGKSINLFNGKDLTGWKPSGTKNQWEVKNGVLISAHSGSNLISEQVFSDFKLHVEFRYSKGSNSGIYLRGRHEVQIEDSPSEEHPSAISIGGIYGFLPPNEIAALGPDKWQKYDITLVGRRITVVFNGKTVICNQEIPGITGGALDSNEGEPGPIYIQGDHGPVEFRKITITPSK